MAVGVKTLRKKVSTIRKNVLSLSKMLNKGVSKRCNCTGKRCCRRRRRKGCKRRRRQTKK